MSGEEKRRRPAPSATPWDGAGDGELSPAERIVRDCHRDMYRYRHAGAGLVGEADFFNGYDRDACPRCGSPAIEGNGRDANGVRRWRCLSCGRAFNPATGTVFDGRKPARHRLDGVPPRGLLLRQPGGRGPVGRRSATTPPYWLAKLLAVLEGVQEGAVLAGRVEIDEMMYPLPLADQPRMPDGSKVPGGFSKGKHCIGIGCDGSGAAVFADEGLGKTSGARTLAAFGGHVARGSTLVHDMENGHNRLVRELGLAQRAAQLQAHQAPARPGEPARRGQPALLSAAPVPRLPHGVRPHQARRLPRPLLGDDEPSPRQDGKGGVRVGSGNAQPENAPIQGLLREVAQFRR